MDMQSSATVGALLAASIGAAALLRLRARGVAQRKGTSTLMIAAPATPAVPVGPPAVEASPYPSVGALRDAPREAPALLAERLPRKARVSGRRAATGWQGPGGEGRAQLQQVFERTAEAWVERIVGQEISWLSDLACGTRESASWFDACRQRFTQFSIGVVTQAGFRDAAAAGDAARMTELVRTWLETKLVRQRHAVWQDGASEGGWVPLWQDTVEARKEGARRFDCMVVEPFSPHWDPTFLLDWAGSHRIAEAVVQLEQTLIAVATPSEHGMSARHYESLLVELHTANNMLQRRLNRAHRRVIASVRAWLQGAVAPLGISLHSLVPFGSIELGCATEKSDVDLMAFAHTTLPPHALVRFAAEALETDPPPWLERGSVQEVLQTAKCPVVSFNVLIPAEEVVEELEEGRDDYQQGGAHGRLARVCRSLFGCGGRPDASDATTPIGRVHRGARMLPVDLTFNAPLVVKETEFMRDSFASNPAAACFLVWLKYWTKACGINEPKEGTLSSFGWRLILLCVLMEQGQVPCLRDGFHRRTGSDGAVGNRSSGNSRDGGRAHIVAGVDTWYRRRPKAERQQDGDGTKDGGSGAPPAGGQLLLQHLLHFSRELRQCVSTDGPPRRVFQAITALPARVPGGGAGAGAAPVASSFDEVWRAMASAADRTNPEVQRAVDMCLLPRHRGGEPVKILVCDVDGCLFDCSAEMLVHDLEDTGTFFFNSKASVPATNAPLVFTFLATAARCHNYQIAIISGRDEAILPACKMRIEARQELCAPGSGGDGQGASGATARLQPFVYLFKPCGSRIPTMDHKRGAVRDLLRCCARSGVKVRMLGVCDDMPPHMAAFLEGAEGFEVPTFALTAAKYDHRTVAPASGPCGGICLRPYLGDVKDLVILALPPGSRKGLILREVARCLSHSRRLGASECESRGLPSHGQEAAGAAGAGSVRIVEWQSSGPEAWPAFMQELVGAMATPRVRYVLVKIVPDVEKARKLALFLGSAGRILCFYHANEAGAAGAKGAADTEKQADQGWDKEAAAGAAVRRAQLSRVLHSNEMRQERPGKGQHIRVPAGLTLWPPADRAAFGAWANQVWADGQYGISCAYTQLVKKSRRAAQLATDPRHRLAQVVACPVAFYRHVASGDGPLHGGAAHETGGQSSDDLLRAQRSAQRMRKAVLELMCRLKERADLRVERPVAEIAQRIADILRRRVCDQVGGGQGADRAGGVLEPGLQLFVGLPKQTS